MRSRSCAGVPRLEHHKIMQAARDRVFADYRLRIGQVVADTHIPEGQALLEQRLDATEIGEGKAVTLLDASRKPAWIKQTGARGVAESLGLDLDSAWPRRMGCVFDALLAPGNDHRRGDVARSKRRRCVLTRSDAAERRAHAPHSRDPRVRACSIAAKRRSTSKRAQRRM